MDVNVLRELYSSPEETAFLLKTLHYLIGSFLLAYACVSIYTLLVKKEKNILSILRESLLVIAGLLLIVFFLLPNGIQVSFSLLPVDPIPRMYVLTGLYVTLIGISNMGYLLGKITRIQWSYLVSFGYSMVGLMFLSHTIIVTDGFSETLYVWGHRIVGYSFLVVGLLHVQGMFYKESTPLWISRVQVTLILLAAILFLVYVESVAGIHENHPLYSLLNSMVFLR
ncbi:hypothetical protein COX05_02110 [candidate division WWE3 bacterium CG22_combo_CG10-13_8_21_14_all_39_12]|uniref:Uncharacterized protein n=2 Tax=Katanobacteria TaxID=422282 RepID=A0A2M7WZZ7_UNCKA|nr:MAG: hypothetical protein COX05_02110 [candidate division WWE3 bacterium CG22_combo_CG10-13_8_21_14_all_39_12]PJA39275.1 MAG: hypothetical protein CO179_05560 [candidate division WWE3 bacterium CG_4_9_14_3_um_filter_39_7]